MDENGVWRKLNNEELHGLYHKPNIHVAKWTRVEVLSKF
jgi:hypothetical protein